METSTESRKMKKQENLFQIKEQCKPFETNPNEMEISDISSKEFQITLMRMFTEVRRAMH